MPPKEIYDHATIAKHVKAVIAKENKFYPYSDSALKEIIEDKYKIDCGNTRQIWMVRNTNDIPNRATRLWLNKHGNS